jgi:hypothetical protein
MLAVVWSLVYIVLNSCEPFLTIQLGVSNLLESSLELTGLMIAANVYK